MADSVESLGEIIKEYANKYVSLTDRIKILEASGVKQTTSKVTGSNIRTTKIVASHKKEPIKIKKVNTSSAKISTRIQ